MPVHNENRQMSTAITLLYSAFECALADVNAHVRAYQDPGLACRGRLSYARTMLQAHPDFDPERYRESVDRAFGLRASTR